MTLEKPLGLFAYFVGEEGDRAGKSLVRANSST